MLGGGSCGGQTGGIKSAKEGISAAKMPLSSHALRAELPGEQELIGGEAILLIWNCGWPIHIAWLSRMHQIKMPGGVLLST